MSAVTPPPPPPPPPSAPIPPAGNINVPRTPIAPSAPHVAFDLGSDSSDKVSMGEIGTDALTLILSLTAFVLLYLDLFQNTKG